MSLHEFLADMVMVIHAVFSIFVTVGLVFILTGVLLAWQWTNNRCFRAIHLAATLFVVIRVWLGVACPFSTAEDSLREKATAPCVLGAAFHERLHRLAFRGDDPQRFARSTTIFGIVVVASFALNKRHRRPSADKTTRGIQRAATDMGTVNSVRIRRSNLQRPGRQSI
jgi:hypothetical protein